MADLRIPIHVETADTRADQALFSALKSEYPELSRALLKKCFKEGKVTYQDKVLIGSRKLAAGTYEFKVKDFEVSEFARPAHASFLPILYQDKEILVLNKSSGVPSVPLSPYETETAVGSALAHFPGLSKVGEKIGKKFEPGLLHRLDTGTSGILVFAKTFSEYERLRCEWKKGRVRKFYRAICSNHESQISLPTPGSFEFRLGHDEKSKKKMKVLRTKLDSENIRGKPLETHTSLLKVLPLTGRLADFEIEIKTGVMHQIRCTLSELGWPVVGDPVYGGQLAKRLWLHAWKIELPLKNGKKLALEAPLPEGWART